MCQANRFDETEGGNPGRLFGAVRLGLTKPFADARTDLRDFQRVGQPCSIEVTFAKTEHLGFRLHAAK